jgi:hypothetical protein
LERKEVNETTVRHERILRKNLKRP